MEAKELVALINKLVDTKIKKYYKDVIKPDIELMIDDAIKSIDIKEEDLISDYSQSDDDIIESGTSGLMDVMDEGVQSKPLVLVNKTKKPVTKFKVGNNALNGILNEMASNPSKYRVAGENDMGAYTSLMSGQYDVSSAETNDWPELKYDISPGSGIPTPSLPGMDAPVRSLDSVKQEVYNQTGGNADIANALVRDYRSILKKADEKAKGVRGGA